MTPIKAPPLTRSAVMITSLVAISMAPGIPATAQDLALEVSLGGATGEYGTDTPVTSIILTNILTFSEGRFFADIDLPVIYQTSNTLTWVGGLPTPRGQGGSEGGGGGGGGGGGW